MEPVSTTTTIGQRAQALYDAARRGDTVWLQWLYQEIEAVDPTLFVCTERRSGALVDLDWTIRKKSAGRTAGWDDVLADEQAAYLEGVYGKLEDNNLWDAVEHLSQAFFRGFAHVSPIYSYDGYGIERFELLDAWNFVRDINAGTWFWNPTASMMLQSYNQLQSVPAEELCSVVRSKHINYPALAIYLRSALGEKAWGQFIERYGIPPVIIIMPPDIDPGLVAEYRQAAEKVAEGGSGALPSGSNVTYAEGGRGVNPFTQFLDHQQQLIVLMATGGMFTSLTGATGIGQGATAAHQETWRAIVQRDAAIIASAINRQITAQLLARAFPGKPHLASFDFETESPPTAEQVFETAGKAKVAGYMIAKEDLEEKTGYRLEEVPPPAPMGGGTPALNRAPTEEPVLPAGETGKILDNMSQIFAETLQNALAAAAASGNAVSAVAKPLQNRRRGFDGERLGSEDETRQNANLSDLEKLTKAYAEDFKDLAAEIAALTALSEEELPAAARALSAKLPELLAEHPEAAEELERIMLEVIPAAPVKNTKVVNSADDCRAQDPATCRTHGTPASKADPRVDTSKFSKDYEADESKWPKYDAADPQAKAHNQQRGRNAILKSLHTGEDIKGAMNRPSLGQIDFQYGKVGTAAMNYEDGFGVSKIAMKHPNALEKIPGIIANGDIYKHDTKADRFYVVAGRNTVVLKKVAGSNAFLITGFDYSKDRIPQIRKNPLVEKNKRASEGGSDA